VGHDAIVPRPQRPADLACVEAQRPLGRHAYWRDADDEQIVVQERELLRPRVPAWIEETHSLVANPMRHALALAEITERTAPREIVEVIGPTPCWNRLYGGM
jgi:hypothetical protein